MKIILMGISLILLLSCAVSNDRIDRSDSNYLQNQYEGGKNYFYNGDFKLAYQIFNKTQKDNIYSKFYIGYMYYFGIYLKKDENTAMQYFKSIYESIIENSKHNDSEAYFFLGFFYYHGIVVKGDVRESLKWFRKASDLDDIRSQAYLGYCLLNGWGNEDDKENALKLLSSAAEKGNYHALFDLGNIYYYGQKVKQDVAYAIELWKKSYAKNMYGEQDINGRLPQRKLGFIYLYGKAPFPSKKSVYPVNYNEALIWLNKAYELNDAPSYYMLSQAYENGWGVIKNDKESFRLMEQAAKLDYKYSWDEIGRFYEFGIGTPKDYSKAFLWYQKAANEGIIVSRFKYAYFLENGYGCERDLEKALELYEETAKFWVPGAQFALARIYTESEIFHRQNYIVAYYWLSQIINLKGEDSVYSKEIDEYYDRAVDLKKYIMQKMTSQQLDEAEFKVNNER